MATRFYFPSTGAAAVSPAFAAWTYTSFAERRAMVTTKINSAEGVGIAEYTDDASPVSVLVRQYVSAPLAAQTLAGTVKGQVRCFNSGGGAPVTAVSVSIRVVSNNGLTFRSPTALALGQYVATTLPWSESGYENRKIADGDALTSVAIQAGDRLVAELGGYELIGPGDSVELRMNFSDNSGTDLPEDETTTALYNSWIEFSQTLLFGDVTAPGIVSASASVPAPSAVPGAVAVAPSIVAASSSAPVPVAAPGAVAAAPSPAAASVAVAMPAVAGNVADSYNPVTPTFQPGLVNALSTPSVLRVHVPSTLGDQNLATFESRPTPASWPVAGTLSVAPAGFLSSVQGSGVISFLRFFCFVRAIQDAPATFTNARFDWSTGTAVLTQAVPSGTYAAVPDFGLRQSADAPFRTGSTAWDWATLLNYLNDVTLKVDYNITTIGNFAQLDCAEVWIEVWGPQGADGGPQTSLIMLIQSGAHVVLKQQSQQEV